jgi:hypothetical protein
MPRNLQVVNVPVPVFTDLRRRRHVSHYTATALSYQPSALNLEIAVRAEGRKLIANAS